MMIASISGLPFREREPDDLFGIALGRESIDTDDERFGWGRYARLTLEGDGGSRTLTDVIVVALHASDERPANVGDLDLELRVGDEVLIVSLAAFMVEWGPPLPATATWVLALCNPHGLTLARPRGVPAMTELWYGIGDVDAWKEDEHGLTARQWKRA